MLVIALAANQVPLPQEGDGSSSLLIWMSPTWQLWDDSPTYVAGLSAAPVIQTALWMTALVVAGWLFWRRPTMTSSGSAALVVTTAAVVAVIAVVSTSAALPLDATRRQFRCRRTCVVSDAGNVQYGRASNRCEIRSAVGRERRRAASAVFAVRVSWPAAQPAAASSRVERTLSARRRRVRAHGQGIRRGWNRFQSDAGPPNRSGGPAARDVAVAAHAWKRVAAPFPSAARCRVCRISCVPCRWSERSRNCGFELCRSFDVDRRFESPTVRSSADFGVARVFFHDGESNPETEGLWVRGRSTTRLTILKPSESQTSVMLAIHSGARRKQCDPADARLVGANRTGSGSDEEDRRAVECRRTVHPALGNHFRWFRPGGSRHSAAKTGVCSASGSRSSATISPECPKSGDPVFRADLLPFVAAARKVAYRNLHDAASPREHLGGNFVIQFESRCLQVQVVEQRPRKQLQRGHRVSQIPARYKSAPQYSSCGLQRMRATTAPGACCRTNPRV